MSSNTRLSGYGTVAVVDESTQHLNDADGSWVEANVILPAQLIDIVDAKNTDEQPKQSSTNRGDTTSSAQQQQPVFRDVGFAILFLVHLFGFAFIGITYGGCGTGAALDQSSTTTTSSNGGQESQGVSVQVETSMLGMTILLVSSAVLAFIITFFVTAVFVPRFPTLAVQASLYSSTVTYALFGLFLFLSYPSLWTLLFGLFLIGINLWYFFASQRFIPFASANLKMAAKAISVNFGIYFLSLVASIVGVFWMGFWVYTATGLGIFDDVQTAITETANETNYYYDYNDVGVTNAMLGGKGFGLLLSLYWTLNVLTNVTQTTTAGVTGTWCFDKEKASACCSSAVSQSLFRSCTYSFGSICFGSLLTAFITTIRVMMQWARDSRDNEGARLIYCILVCILSLIEDIVEYFNQWAYVFVGIWGMSYLDSGRRVIELFYARGCTAIFSDGLSSFVLTNIISFTSLVCGVFAYVFGGFNGGCFFGGFIVGLIISAVMMTILQGSVKAVIVCFVDHPHRLYDNHPEDTIQLAEAIGRAYPSVAVPVFINTTV